MMTGHTTEQRKLAALLSADVHGYSRLMGRDEAETVRSLRACRDLIASRVEAFGGRVVDSPGDNVLSEFASVVKAVQAAVEIQVALSERNVGRVQEEQMEFRIGVHLGDVIVDGERLYGDGVNVAARLESLAEPGGICISDDVQRQIEGKLAVEFQDLGQRHLKNIARPVRVYRVWPEAPEVGSEDDAQQEIRFCTADDGVRIAYATAGSGPPLVKAANWLNHLEHDWISPAWRHVLRGLTRDFFLVRYDERGNGLSDWDAEDISFDSFVTDLETVVDAVGLERFPLLGISQGCSVCVAYAVRHPQRVTRLVLYGGYARGVRKRGDPQAEEHADAVITLMRQGWGRENPAFRQLWTTRFMPEATQEQAKWFNDLQRITASPENAIRIRRVLDHIDVTSLLAKVTAPTLVLHGRGDDAVPFEEGRRLAAGIPGARFVALDSRNHMILENEPAWPRFMEEVRSFLLE
jgi:class 3 adenylate cyclase/pimeloyl-ACP methyl ester carboxylesterase